MCFRQEFSWNSCSRTGCRWVAQCNRLPLSSSLRNTWILTVLNPHPSENFVVRAHCCTQTMLSRDMSKLQVLLASIIETLDRLAKMYMYMAGYSVHYSSDGMQTQIAAQTFCTRIADLVQSRSCIHFVRVMPACHGKSVLKSTIFNHRGLARRPTWSQSSCSKTVFPSEEV